MGGFGPREFVAPAVLRPPAYRILVMWSGRTLGEVALWTRRGAVGEPDTPVWHDRQECRVHLSEPDTPVWREQECRSHSVSQTLLSGMTGRSAGPTLVSQSPAKESVGIVPFFGLVEVKTVEPALLGFDVFDWVGEPLDERRRTGGAHAGEDAGEERGGRRCVRLRLNCCGASNCHGGIWMKTTRPDMAVARMPSPMMSIPQ